VNPAIRSSLWHRRCWLSCSARRSAISCAACPWIKGACRACLCSRISCPVRIGIFDWYTTLVGLFTLGLLPGHGPYFSSGERPDRFKNEPSRARRVWRVVVPLWVVVRWRRLGSSGHLAICSLVLWSIVLVLVMRPARLGVFKYSRDGRNWRRSCLGRVLVGLMAATMAGNYPFGLRSTVDPSYASPRRIPPPQATAKSRPALVCRGITLAWLFVNSFVRFGEKLPGMQTVTATKRLSEGVLSPEGGGRQ